MKNLKKFAVLGFALVATNSFAGGGGCDSTFAAWDSVNTGANPANNLTATDVDPIEGNCSLRVPLEFAGKRYVQDDMAQETSFRMSFKFDPNSIAMPTSGEQRRIKMASVLCVDGGNGCGIDAAGNPNFQGWWQTKLRLQAGGYRLGSWAQDDSGVRYSHTVPLVDGCNTVEIQLVAGNPGIYRLWINNTDENAPDFEVTDANFAQKFTDTARIGKTATGFNLIGDPNKFILIDSYEARRQSFIGDSCAP